MGGEKVRRFGRRQGFVLLLIGLAACSSSESSPTTVPKSTTSAVSAEPTSPTTAAPTTIATTTSTMLTTTAPPTTAAPTTTDPSVQAKQEITDTLDAFNADYDGCVNSPQNCDISALLDTYVVPDDPGIRGFLQRGWDYYSSNGLVNVNDGLVDRRVASINVSEDGLNGSTHLCEVDSSYDAPAPQDGVPTTVPSDLEVVYAQYYYDWQKQPDGNWLITHSEYAFGLDPNVLAEGSVPSVSEEETSTCFK